MSGLRVKVSHHFKNWPLIDQTPRSSGQFAGNQFLISTESVECDAWVVFDGLFENEMAQCPPEQTIFVVGEPPTIRSYKKSFLKQFAYVIGCANYSHPKVILRQQGQPWYSGESYDTHIAVAHEKKEKEIAIFTSGRQFTKHQKLRHQFYKKVKEKFGKRVDIYGTGVGAFCSKAEILKDYRYSLAIENTVCDHYITEKMPDCFLSECFPFYFGAQNVDDYFSERSFQRIDIEDVEISLAIMQRILNDKDHYEQHRKELREAKQNYLLKIQFFAMISETIRELNFKQSQSTEKHRILSEKYFGLSGVKKKIINIFNSHSSQSFVRSGESF